MAGDARHGGPAGPHPGRRERKKAEVRQRISDVATALFLDRGFDQVSVSEVAEAADVARPTVFAHFPRKEDLFFDRYPEVAGELTRAIRERPAGTSAVSALRDTLMAAAQAGQAPYGLQTDMIPWWRTVAASRALQARARELADQLSNRPGARHGRHRHSRTRACRGPRCRRLPRCPPRCRPPHPRRRRRRNDRGTAPSPDPLGAQRRGPDDGINRAGGLAEDARPQAGEGGGRRYAASASAPLMTWPPSVPAACPSGPAMTANQVTHGRSGNPAQVTASVDQDRPATPASQADSASSIGGDPYDDRRLARLGLSCTRVAMRCFVRSKLQVAKQIKQAGRRRSVCGVFEDRTR